MKTLAIVLGLVGAALGPVGAGAALFTVVGTFLTSCTGCTIEEGRWLGWGMLVAAVGGLVVAIGVIGAVRRPLLLAWFGLVGAVVLTAAMVLIALDSAELALYDDNRLAEVTGLGFLYALWGAGGILLLGGAMAAFHATSAPSNEGYTKG